jgi:phosphatidylserine decarboxylase
MTIHKEGYPSLAIAFVALFFLNLLSARLFPSQELPAYIVLGISVFLFLIVLQFFRSPKVVINQNENQILAPADGKVVVIEETEESEFLKEKRIQVSIFMSPLNVHINRNPIGGKVTYCKYHPGKYLVAWHPKSSTENERTSIAIQNQRGSLLMRQIAGALARRIVWYVKEGEQVNQGEEFGFIKFGSRVDIFLPLTASIKVQIGQKTTGGKTVIAEW